MPKEKSYKWKLGLFAIAALVVAVGAIYYIGKQKNKFGSVLHISAQFASVSGLKPGSNVRLGGIDVGTVDEIGLVTDTTVQVDMIIQRKVQKFIKTDAIMASLKTSADNAAIITGNLADISSRITHGKGALGKLLHDTTLSSNISATMKNLK